VTVLRPYQTEIIESVTREVRAARRSVLIQGSTGIGKGVIFDALIHRAVTKGKRVLFVSHRKELNDQISRMLDRRSIEHGIFSRQHWRYRPGLPVQVASIQTLARAEAKPDADLLLVDEAHHVAAGQYQEVLALYPKAVLIGASATPERLDGKGLGDVFQAMVCAPSMGELVELGYLLPFRVFAPEQPDLTGVKKSHGDYNLKQLDEAVRRSTTRLGGITREYRDKANGMRAIAFCVSIEDSKALAQQFCDDGIAAEHVDGTMPTGQRDAILARLRDGQTMVVTNVQLWTEGVDVPVVNCVILGRPTESLGLYLQQVGRGARPHPGQEYCLVLDHAGCVHRHGLPTQPRHWSLEGRVARTKKDDAIVPLVTCESCGTIRPHTQTFCSTCRGVQTSVFKGIPIEVDGKLVEVTSIYRCSKCDGSNVKLEGRELQVLVDCRDCKHRSYEPDKIAARQASESRRRQEYERLEAVRARKGFKEGWVSHAYRNLFGTWPPKAWRRQEQEQEQP